MSEHKLYRSTQDKMLGGVCCGLAEYFQADVTLIRLITVVIAIITSGLGLVAYLVAWIIIPLNPAEGRGAYPVAPRSEYSSGGANEGAGKEVQPGAEGPVSRDGKKLAGIILILLGVLFFCDYWLPEWFSFDHLWPVILIVIGGAFIWRSRNN